MQVELLAALKKVSTLEYEMESLREECSGRDGSQRALEGNLAKLKKEIVEHQTTISELESNLANSQEKNEALQNEVNLQQDQLDEMTVANKAAQLKKSELENEIITLKKKVDKLEIQVAEERRAKVTTSFY